MSTCLERNMPQLSNIKILNRQIFFSKYLCLAFSSPNGAPFYHVIRKRTMPYFMKQG
eukprot:c9587_g1_i1 orf=7-177(-)